MKVSGAVAMADDPEHAFGEGWHITDHGELERQTGPTQVEIDRVASAMEQAMISATPEKAQCSRDLSRIMAIAAIKAIRAP